MPVSLDRIKCTNCHCSVLKDGDRLVCPVCGEGDTEANVIEEIGRMTGGLMGELNDIFSQGVQNTPIFGVTATGPAPMKGRFYLDDVEDKARD